MYHNQHQTSEKPSQCLIRYTYACGRATYSRCLLKTFLVEITPSEWRYKVVGCSPALPHFRDGPGVYMYMYMYTTTCRSICHSHHIEIQYTYMYVGLTHTHAHTHTHTHTYTHTHTCRAFRLKRSTSIFLNSCKWQSLLPLMFIYYNWPVCINAQLLRVTNISCIFFVLATCTSTWMTSP